MSNLKENSVTHVDLWRYGNTGCGVWGTKLERFLPKNQHTQRTLLNFENWINGGLRSFQKSEINYCHHPMHLTK